MAIGRMPLCEGQLAGRILEIFLAYLVINTDYWHSTFELCVDYLIPELRK
ncbi:hypothetical protein V7O67_10285 [Methanolobus sp. ZRKC4]